MAHRRPVPYMQARDARRLGWVGKGLEPASLGDLECSLQVADCLV